ncbi:unnamed protein product, partial [Effrenium voratum]
RGEVPQEPRAGAEARPHLPLGANVHGRHHRHDRPRPLRPLWRIPVPVHEPD